jgi:hypothetical protein
LLSLFTFYRAGIASRHNSFACMNLRVIKTQRTLDFIKRLKHGALLGMSNVEWLLLLIAVLLVFVVILLSALVEANDKAMEQFRHLWPTYLIAAGFFGAVVGLGWLVEEFLL